MVLFRRIYELHVHYSQAVFFIKKKKKIIKKRKQETNSKPTVGLKRLNGNGVTRNAAELPKVLNYLFSIVGQKLAANVRDANCHYKEYLANANFPSSFSLNQLFPLILD